MKRLPTWPCRFAHLEVVAWLFMRLSGIMLLLLALGHLYVMHVLYRSSDVDYAFVLARWAHPFWRVYDWLFLTLGVLHGGNGLRIVIEDQIQHRSSRRWALSIVAAGVLVMLVVGTLVIAYTGRS